MLLIFSGLIDLGKPMGRAKALRSKGAKEDQKVSKPLLSD